jgi:hypothetical protein
MRLIDADFVKHTYSQDFFDTLDDFERVNDIIDYAPTVDAVLIVRCNDCKWHHDCGVHFCDRLGMDCPDDSEFFCKYGELKEN